MPRVLNDAQIEDYLEEIIGIPDDPLSEDDLESDEEVYSIEALQSILEAPDSVVLPGNPDPDPVASTSSQPTSERLGSPHLLNKDFEDPPVNIEAEISEDSSYAEEVTESEESDVENDDSWQKRTWITRPEPEIFDKVPVKPQYLCNSRVRPVAHFHKFFNDEVYELIVTQTNLYAQQCGIKNWTPVNRAEIQAFLGIFIIMGYNILPNMDLYWSSDPGFRVNEIADVMPIKRFKKILEALHLNDNSQILDKSDPNYDKLHKLRPLLNLLNRVFQTNANNSSSQSIDESMILFKGRSAMKQYMPLKPIKRGYKVWCRCDSSTGYLYEFELYTGKSGTNIEEGLGSKVVKNLSTKLISEEFAIHVTFDNFFCDFSILQYLHEKDVFATGTVRRNRSDLPSIIKSTTKNRKKSLKLKKGQFKWRIKQDVAFVVWQDTKEVLLLTNAFHPKQGKTTVGRTQKDGSTKAIPCPRVVKEYTKRMGGVDRFDRLKSTYSVGRRSKRWWLRIFYFLFDACLTNSFILYSKSTRTVKLSNLEFRVAVARGMIGCYSSRKRRSSNMPTYVSRKARVSESDNYQKTISAVPVEVRFQNVGDHMPVDLPSYRRCKLCSTKTNDKRSKIQCEKCAVPLCITPCFAAFHRP